MKTSQAKLHLGDMTVYGKVEEYNNCKVFKGSRFLTKHKVINPLHVAVKKLLSRTHAMIEIQDSDTYLLDLEKLKAFGVGSDMTLHVTIEER